jgi:hypothetical protein
MKSLITRRTCYEAVSGVEFKKLKNYTDTASMRRTGPTRYWLAQKYGEVHYLSTVSGLPPCSAFDLRADKILFAVATHPVFRKQDFSGRICGLRQKRGQYRCIPEEEACSGFTKVGLYKIRKRLQVKADGTQSARSKNRNIDMNNLYRIYQSSPLYPHKPRICLHPR